MVNNFSSLSSHHPNWPQQPVGGLDGACGGGDQEFSQVLPPRQMPPMGGGVTDRGRMRKPDTAMKCPRCESTNTKFCYFNNYSLSQPRHFCKSCRRYWTRGGALRNVPMGGGCRRNKKTTKGSSRASRSKSPGATTSNVLGHSPHTTRPPQFPILPPMHHYPGLTFGAGNGNDLINTGGDHASNYPNKIFAHFSILEATDGGYGEQIEGMKMEENHHQQQHQGMNMSRNFLGISGNYDQFLGTSNAAWGTTDHLSGLTSSSTNTACYPSLLN